MNRYERLVLRFMKLVLNDDPDEKEVRSLLSDIHQYEHDAAQGQIPEEK